MSTKTKAKTQTVSTGGLYGSSTTGRHGSTYDPSDFEKQIVNMTTSYIPQYFEQLVNPTYDSAVFQAQTEARNKLASKSFENNLINPLASRGLTRGSSINQMSNQFASKLADLETEAMANEDTRNATMLGNLFNYYQIPFSMMNSLQKNSADAYQTSVAQAEQENNRRLEAFKTIYNSALRGAAAAATGGTSEAANAG